MKTAKKFSDLPKNEQIYQIHHFGKFLSKREIPQFEISLYIIDNQLVETWYNFEKERIEKFIQVESDFVIDHYSVDLNFDSSTE